MASPYEMPAGIGGIYFISYSVVHRIFHNFRKEIISFCDEGAIFHFAIYEEVISVERK